MARRYYSSTAVATTLSGNINNSTTSITVAALSGYPAQTPFTAIIDPDTASEEVVEVTNVSGTTLTVTRGVDGTTASSHNAGAVFRHGVSARDFDEANAFVNGGGIANALISAANGVASLDSGGQVPATQLGNAVTKSLVNAKGDIVTATANDTPAIQSVGANGEVLYADSSATNGLRWQSTYNAGRNRVINGGFNVWQRSTSNSSLQDQKVNTADRWFWAGNGSGATRTESRQAFGAGDIPGYNPQYFYRFNQSVAGTGASVQILDNRIEDVRTLAGQTVTLSFWAKADTARTISVSAIQDWNSASGQTGLGLGDVTLTTAWQRFTYTATLGSISGKTIGANSWLGARFNLPLNTVFTLDLWGVQLEAGSLATRFEEEPYAETLRKCQRYYVRFGGGGDLYETLGGGVAISTTVGRIFMQFPVTMRVAPTAVEFSSIKIDDQVSVGAGITAVSMVSPGRDTTLISCTVGSGLTQYRPVGLFGNNSTSAHVSFSAEL